MIWFCRDWDRCIEHCRSALEINRDYSGVRWIMANALQSKGSHEEAIRERQRLVAAAPGSVLFLADLGSSYAAAGMRSEALRVLDQLDQLHGHNYVSAHWRALIYDLLDRMKQGHR